MKLLEIHDRTNHCVSIKEIQVMASMGIFDSKLASCQPPVCASCMIGCAHKKPWRVKVKEKHGIRSESETASGDNTSLDALTSSTPGIIPKMSGFLTSDCFWAATGFFRPCHLVHVYPPTTRPNSNKIHRGQSSI